MLRLSIVAEEARRRILEAAFRVLEGTGVQVDHPEVFRRLCEAGCGADEEKRRIFFPRQLVERTVSLCPPQARLADRQGGVFVAEPDGPSAFFTADAMNYTEGKETRAITLKDFAGFCRVVDAMPNIQGAVSTCIGEVPAGARDFVAFRVMLENTSKHLKPNIFSPDGCSVMLEMAHAIADEAGTDLRSYPVFTFGHSICSPLRWVYEGLEALLRSSGYGLPSQITSECIAGATAPVTLAGTLVLANAQALSGVVINQVLEPGRPCIYNLGFSHVMDMKAAEPTTGAAENGLIAAAGAAFARDLGLPSAAWTCSDSACVDSQSALERTLVGVLQLLGGASIIWGAGNLESQKALSAEQAVIDNEIFGAAFRAQRGIEVEEEKLALELIHEMKSEAAYLGSAHTRRHFRSELANPKLLNRHRRSLWEERGAKTLEEAARDEVARILAEPKRETMDPRALERVRAIEKRALERLIR